MTEPIDHAAEARNYLGAAVIDTHGDDDRKVAIAAVHAQLASVAVQDRANELKRIEILVALANSNHPNLGEQVAQDAVDGLVDLHLHVDKDMGGWWQLAPSIARSLGLGGESDGE